jgi:hypothetical protein
MNLNDDTQSYFTRAFEDDVFGPSVNCPPLEKDQKIQKVCGSRLTVLLGGLADTLEARHPDPPAVHAPITAASRKNQPLFRSLARQTDTNQARSARQQSYQRSQRHVHRPGHRCAQADPSRIEEEAPARWSLRFASSCTSSTHADPSDADRSVQQLVGSQSRSATSA